MKTVAALVVLALVSPPITHAAHAAAPPDSALWLEDVTGKRALEWVAGKNRVSTHALTGTQDFKKMNDRFLAIVNSQARIPYVTRIGDRYYNFWQDQKHVRGLWRRTTLEEYRKESPRWETVLDLDSLATVEKENWVWESADPLPPDYRLCLVSLSRGGADAQVTREFDLVTRSFVKGGFAVPESKGYTGWIDADRLYVCPALDSTQMTTSGYPRSVREWRRGQPLASATAVYEGQPTDVYVYGWHDFTPGFERDFVTRGVTFYSNEMFLRRDGRLVKIEKPDDAEAGVWREWLLLQLRTDWTAGGQVYPAGALIATRLDDFLAGKRGFDVLFQPADRKSLTSYSTTRNAILLNELDNVRCRIETVRFADGKWSHEALPGLPEYGDVSAGGVDDRVSDDYWLRATDFLTPPRFGIGTVGGGPAVTLKRSPTFFDGSRDTVTQHEAVSKDGTHIPYFEVSRRNEPYRGTTPTLLTGYGGFEVSELPRYSGIQGSGWIERGGVLVLANIRGGGEFGPKWHQAGVKTERHHCYEDFIAVAEDLIQRGVTSPKHLGCIGGSNGGLLVGNMLTMRPDLFGAIVCEQPLLDMRRYHKLLAGASWMGEYGNPDDPKEWEFIRTWSPYQNLRPGMTYPPTLFTSSTRDDRVHPGHARRMVHRMDEMGYHVLYYENVEGGHAGAANNKETAFMSALAYTFLWQRLAGNAAPAP
jgi:prolyl oligopeptidase